MPQEFLRKCDNIDIITCNYRHSDIDFLQGFIQGILTVALNEPSSPTLPKRYIQALRDLSKDNNIRVTSADKGGGVVILDSATYIEKMNDLLNDENTYERVPHTEAEKETNDFIHKTRTTPQEE